jgi:serine/threonine-protein kinase
MIAAAVLPFVIGYGIAVFLLFPAPAATAEGIATPRVVGMTVQTAHRTLAQAGLGVLQVTPLPHPTQPVGTIIAQSPLPGQQVRAEASVRVAVSSGPPRAVVPDVVGFSIDRAEGLMRKLGFDVVRVDERAAEPAGRVLRTLPPAGRAETLPAQVQIVVSTGVVDTLPSAVRSSMLARAR